MCKLQKRILSTVMAAVLLITSILGVNLMQASAADADYTFDGNYVSQEINNFAEFVNPDEGRGTWDMADKYNTIDGAANYAWYAWHNQAGSTDYAIIPDADTMSPKGNKTLKYNADNGGAFACFWLKLEPGEYAFSFRYKSENASGASLPYAVKQADLSKVGDCAINSESMATAIASKTVRFAAGSTDWTVETINFTVTGDDTKAICFFLNPVGTADGIWMADFAVKAVISSNLVSSNINNMVMFANPDSSYGPWNVPSEYVTLSGAANNVWYAWHNGAGSGTGFIASDTSVYRDNDASIKYVGNANGGTWMYYWMQLDPGDYSFSFWYKGENMDSAYVKCGISSNEWDAVKDTAFNAASVSTTIVAEKAFDLADGASEWTQFRVSFTVNGESAQAVRLAVCPHGAADALYLADFTVESADSIGLVSSNINNMAMFSNPNSSYGPWNVPSEYATVSGAANNVWYAWHNGADSGTGFIASDTSVYRDNDASIKYVGNANGGTWMYYWMQLDPGDYSFSFWYKGENMDSAYVKCGISSNEWDAVKDTAFNAASVSTTIVAEKAFDLADGASEWTQFRVSFTVNGESAQAVHLAVCPHGAADALYLADFDIVSTDADIADKIELSTPVMVGRATQLAYILPAYTDAIVTYDTDVATVENGAIAAKNAGDINIKVTVDGASQYYVITSYAKGDVNMSGEVDIVDLVRLKKAIAGIIKYDMFYDLGENSAVNDIIALRKILLG